MVFVYQLTLVGINHCYQDLTSPNTKSPFLKVVLPQSIILGNEVMTNHFKIITYLFVMLSRGLLVLYGIVECTEEFKYHIDDSAIL